jgi:hypothetical protein
MSAFGRFTWAKPLHCKPFLGFLCTNDHHVPTLTILIPNSGGMAPTVGPVAIACAANTHIFPFKMPLINYPR